MSDQELQNPDNWDWDKAEAHEPVKDGRTIVSVSFERADFQRIAAMAELQGNKVTEYIRNAVLAKVNPLPEVQTATLSRTTVWPSAPITTSGTSAKWHSFGNGAER